MNDSSGSFVEFRQFFERGQGSADHVRGHAVGDPDKTGRSEAVCRDEQEVELLGFFTELAGVRDLGLHEQIERAVRMDTGKAVFGERAAEDVAVFFIDTQVRDLSGAFFHDVLHQAGSAHIAESPACAADGSIDIL